MAEVPKNRSEFLIEALRSAFPKAQRLNVPDPETLVAEPAVAALRRFPDLLRGILVLHDERLDLEAEALVRIVIEGAITVAWVGTDAERARAYKDEGVRRGRILRDAMVRERVALDAEATRRIEGFVASGTGTKLPPVEQRAESLKSEIARVAYMFYRRQSGSIHMDYRVAATVLTAPDDLRSATHNFVAHEAVVASIFLLSTAADVLSFEDARIISKDLENAFYVSIGRTPPA